MPRMPSPVKASGLALLLLSSVALAPAGAFADAREYFRRGENAYQQGNYELAIEQWQKAYTQEKRPLIQYDLSLAFERLGALDKAIGALKKFLEIADPDDQAIKDAQTRLSMLEQRLAATGIHITGGVEGSRILIDGRDWGLLPRPDKIAVQPGSHDIVLRLKGYSDFVSNVVVPAGQVVEVSAKMKKEGEGEERPTFFDQRSAGKVEEKSESSGRDPTFWYVASGVLAAGTVGAAIWTGERAGQLKDCEDTDNYYCKNEKTVEREKNLAALTTIVFGAGAIATLVYALIIDSSGGSASEDGDAGQQARAVPCAPTLTGASCALRF